MQESRGTSCSLEIKGLETVLGSLGSTPGRSLTVSSAQRLDCLGWQVRGASSKSQRFGRTWEDGFISPPPHVSNPRVRSAQEMGCKMLTGEILCPARKEICFGGKHGCVLSWWWLPSITWTALALPPLSGCFSTECVFGVG